MIAHSKFQGAFVHLSLRSCSNRKYPAPKFCRKLHLLFVAEPCLSNIFVEVQLALDDD